MEAGEPREVTFAPSVAPEEVMELCVGVVTVGTALATQDDTLQVVPEVQFVATFVWASKTPLL